MNNPISYRTAVLAALWVVAATAQAATPATPATPANAAKPAHAGHDNHDGHHSTAIGVPGVAAEVSRTINISMRDTMRFDPAAIAVKRGETIRFVVKNEGQLKHEFNLGTAAELKKHYALMLKFPEMEHDDPNQVSLEQGKTGEVIWKFSKPGTVSFACLHPGHYEAGMKGAVTVSNR